MFWRICGTLERSPLRARCEGARGWDMIVCDLKAENHSNAHEYERNGNQIFYDAVLNIVSVPSRETPFGPQVKAVLA